MEKYYFLIIGALIGIPLIIYSVKKLKQLKSLKEVEGVVVSFGYKHRVNDDGDRTTRVEFIIDSIKREEDLNFYNAFWKKGKKIKIYYDLQKQTIDCKEGYYFVLFIGLIFFVGSMIVSVIL